MNAELPSQTEMLKEVMRYAVSGTYRYEGEGDNWPWLPEELATATRTKAYLRVLRSEEFCKAYWTPRIVAGSLAHGAPPTDLVVQQLPEDFQTRWKPHHDKLQNESDPIRYCWLNMPNS